MFLNKIILIIDSLGAGGAERSTAELAFYLKSKGVDVLIVSLKKVNIGIEEEVISNGIRVVHLSSYSFIRRIQKLYKLIRIESPEIIHSTLIISNWSLRFVKQFIRKLSIVQSLVNTPYSSERIADNKFPHNKFKIIRLIDVVSARLTKSYYHSITNEVFRHYQPLFKIRQNKNFVIYRGRKENPHLNHKEELKVKFGFDNNFVLSVVGRQEFQKGHLLVLEALKELVTNNTIPKNIRIVFLGREGVMTEMIKQFVKVNSLDKYVSFPGFRNDVEEWLVASDAFVFPSYFEGLGGALIEAMAAGLPIICSDLPVLKEVIGKDEGALFVEVANSKSLSEAIHRIYHDKNLRENLSNYSLSRFRKEFIIEDKHEQMLRMYNEILVRNDSC